MSSFTQKTVSVNVENLNPRNQIAKVKRLPSVFAMPIRETLRFWRWVTQSAFVKEIVTINIENSGLRFLVTKGKWVKDWGTVPLALSVVREGLILDYQAVGAAVSELFASKRLKKSNVIPSLSGIQSIHRVVDLPKMPKKLLREAIIGEAKKAMSISLEKIYLS